MRRIKDHTFEKLQYIRKYVSAYLVATKSIRVKYYIDAFSGTGKCVLCSESCNSKGSKCNCGKGKIVDGSAMVVIKQPQKFSKYFLFELGPKNFKELVKCLESESGDKLKLIETVKGDCNIEIPKIIGKLNGFGSCLALLDPEGPELDWKTIESLAKFRRMDLLVLFPYDMALSRLVKDYQEKNDYFFGSKEWQSAHASAPTIQSRRTKMLEYFTNNLKDLGFTHIVSKLIKSRYRGGNPLYHFILASRYNVAAKIMNDIFEKSLDTQRKLFK